MFSRSAPRGFRPARARVRCWVVSSAGGGRPSVPNSAVRRVVFTVVDPAASKSARGHDGHGRETEVDAIDLTRSRSYRPLAAGRSPAAEPGRFAWAVPPEALIEPSRRERLLGWIMRAGAEASKLDPANASGLAWSAIGLKVAHPDRPHRLTLKVRGGEPAALGVALIEPGSGGAGSAPRLLLDACASGPPILQDGPAAAFSWLVWPTSRRDGARAHESQSRRRGPARDRDPYRARWSAQGRRISRQRVLRQADVGALPERTARSRTFRRRSGGVGSV